MKNKIIVINTNPLFKDVEPQFSNIFRKKNYYVIYVVNSNEDKNFYKKNFPGFFDKILSTKNEFEYIKKPQNSYVLIQKAKIVHITIYLKLLLQRQNSGKNF